MSYFSRTKKLLLAAGLASCGAAAAVISCSYTNVDSLKARAASALHKHLNDNFDNPSYISAKWDYNWDKREPQSLVKPIKGSLGQGIVTEEEQNSYNEKLERVKSVATRHLILVRHGQYMDGKSDELRLLTPLGEEQANHVGLRLKELSLPYTRIVQSTMTRATQTASIISKYLPNLPVDSCDFIREGAPVKPEPPSMDWRPYDMHFFIDGARIEAAFRKYFHRADAKQEKDSYEILVCHGNVIRYFMCRALQLPADAWIRFNLMHNCSLTWIAIFPSGRVTVDIFGDIGHMPPSKMTTS